MSVRMLSVFVRLGKCVKWVDENGLLQSVRDFE